MNAAADPERWAKIDRLYHEVLERKPEQRDLYIGRTNTHAEDLPQNNGVLFPAGNESALAEAIVELLDDHDLRRRLAEQSATRVEQKCSWNATTSVYAEIYGNAQKVNSARFLASPQRPS